MANSAEAFQGLEKSLSDIVGAEWVSKGKSYLTVRPRTSDEVSQILKVANRTGTPVTPRGGGTGWWGTDQPRAGGVLISMTRMDQVKIIDEDAMTVTVEAGITFTRLESEISKKGYRVLIFPESGDSATVGGHVQTWGTSPYTSSVFEDQATQIVGLKVVLPTGEIVQTGSGAVKTAAGNFARRFFPSDITGLFIGGEGAFGIITEVTLKMYGLPETMMTRVVGFTDLQSAVLTLRKLVEAQRKGGLATIVEQRFVAKESVVRAIPRLESGLAEASRILMLRADGDAGDVERHMAIAVEMSRSEGGKVVDDDVPEWWEGRYGHFPQAGIGKGPRIMVVALVPLGRLLEASEAAEQFGKDHGIEIAVRGYPFGGPIVSAHAHISYKAATPKAREKALSLGRGLMEVLMSAGCVPHRVGTDFLPVLTQKLDPTYYTLVKKIKHALDPNRIMNPDAIVAEKMAKFTDDDPTG